MAVGLSLHPRAPGRKQSPARNLLERLHDRSADVLRFADNPGVVLFTNNTREVRHEVARFEWTRWKEGRQMMLAA